MSERKVALVTHGMSALGSAICRRLHDDGYHVVASFSARHNAPEAWLAAQRDDGYAFTTLGADVGEEASCRAMAGKILAMLGRLDVLVALAMLPDQLTPAATGLDALTAQRWHATRSTVLGSAFFLHQSVLPAMLERRWGRIIQVAAGPVWPLAGAARPIDQSAVNAALHGFTRALALEVARHGVTVNTVLPGHLREGGAIDCMDTPQCAADASLFVSAIPVGRLGEAAEVAGLVAYLASDSAGFVTGAQIAINGGQHMS